MKCNFISFLFLLLITAPSCFGAVVTDSMLTVIIPSAAVVNNVPSSINNSSINPQTGSHTGLGAVFAVKTNGDDNSYDFVLSSSITTAAGEKNGYFLKDGNLYLILANKEHLPDLNSLVDISSGTPQKNKNMIAYQIMKNADFQTIYQNYNGILCCKFLSAGKQNFNVFQQIVNTPLSGTYSLDDDGAGIYEAVITLNIYRKP